MYRASVEVEGDAVGPRPVLGGFLAAALIALVAVDVWILNGYVRAPDHSVRGSFLALGASGFVASIHALWYLRVVSTGRRGWLGGWWGASVSYALAAGLEVAFGVVAVVSVEISGM
jgi:hypothetical protein